jgi:2-amino-4-hydroxy-6-hydroxymethyldihydropteridine diphosphokinase
MAPAGELVYVALGANLGDRERTFAAVVEAIESDPDVDLQRASPIFETEPMGPSGQGAYLNAVVQLDSRIGPVELLRRLKALERSLGRNRDQERIRWGPRVIDLDIIFFGTLQLDTPDLVIPHSEAHLRLFVMAPLAEIAPDFIHPTLSIPVAEIARSLLAGDPVRRWPSPSGWPESG